MDKQNNQGGRKRQEQRLLKRSAQSSGRIDSLFAKQRR